MTLDELKDIDPSKIKDARGFQKVLEILINAVEDLAQENAKLKAENRRLQDENAGLKGGNARPVLNGKKKPDTDISSGGKEKGRRKAERIKDRDKKPRTIEIDQQIKVEMDAKELPADAVFKGYARYHQQDLEIRRNNKRFLLATYYSPSENKTYKAALPAGEVAGHFGAGVRGLLNILHHYANVTENSLAGLMEGFGIQISSGTISNLLQAEHDWSVEEQAAILQAGLTPQTPIQMDCTGNRQRGENKTTHIITSPSFSVFYTLDSKSRMDCLRALQGNPVEGVRLMWHKGMERTFRCSKVSQSESEQVMDLLEKHAARQLSIREFDALLQTHAPAVYAKSRIVSILKELMALYYYDNQDEFVRLKTLLTDDAPEYNKIAYNHGLCWIHDARYYNKLSPQLAITKKKLEAFKTRYWDFYQGLLDYKGISKKEQNTQKLKIIKAFDRLFRPTTKYGLLDLCIERTGNNKDQLLLVLDYPDLPLHNNAAELAARKVVRKRDISLHTWTDWGTRLRDAFLSITETARKLNVPIYNYINDRITGQCMLPSLAQLVIANSS
ncbi:MAG: IS66 family transposase [Candidatus Saccharimonadales bacterium]